MALDPAQLQQAAKDHLWMHFTRHGSYKDNDVPVIVRGEGAYIWDSNGKKYLDALAGLFVSQLGHGRADLAEAAAKQAEQLAFMPLWSYAHPNAIELAARVADYAPGSLNRVFFTSGGGEAVETAWKLAKNYFKLTGKPMKHKVHLAHDRLPRHHPGRAVDHRAARAQAAVRAAGALDVPRARTPTSTARPSTSPTTSRAFGRWAADQIAVQIENEGPDTVAAVFLEPVQNAGGCFPPPPGYFQRVREICDEYDVLLVSDEVICAFGRLGHMFGSERYGYEPDMITCAKGITSGYAPLGAMIASDRLMEPFQADGAMFAHGYTFGGHPVSTAVALANLDAFENENILEGVRANEAAFRSTLERLKDLPIVGDVRGDGFFYGIELVKDKATKETFSDEECERLLYGFVSKQLYAEGLYCRADDRGDPVVQLSPPLNCTQEHFDEMEQILRVVLDKAGSLIDDSPSSS